MIRWAASRTGWLCDDFVLFDDFFVVFASFDRYVPTHRGRGTIGNLNVISFDIVRAG